jgi:hypothetical protein
MSRASARRFPTDGHSAAFIARASFTGTVDPFIEAARMASSRQPASEHAAPATSWWWGWRDLSDERKEGGHAGRWR